MLNKLQDLDERVDELVVKVEVALDARKQPLPKRRVAQAKRQLEDVVF